MPLTSYQAELAALLASNRSQDNYLAGGAALLLEPNSKRYSNDLDYFQDSVERVATAFADDEALLTASGHEVAVGIRQPGYIRAQVRRGDQSTKLEWAHDSAWRFMPTVGNPEVGFLLHPVDLAINKVLALAGRNEPRDLLDVLHIHAEILPLGALCWAAAGKDPGFTPRLLLELLRRRGAVRQEDLARLHLRGPVDLPELKSRWLDALDEAEEFVRARPPAELGCLYYSKTAQRFVQPEQDAGPERAITPHYGRPGGVLPRIPD